MSAVAAAWEAWEALEERRSGMTAAAVPDHIVAVAAGNPSAAAVGSPLAAAVDSPFAVAAAAAVVEIPSAELA